MNAHLIRFFGEGPMAEAKKKKVKSLCWTDNNKGKQQPLAAAIVDSEEEVEKKATFADIPIKSILKRRGTREPEKQSAKQVVSVS